MLLTQLWNCRNADKKPTRTFWAGRWRRGASSNSSRSAPTPWRGHVTLAATAHAHKTAATPAAAIDPVLHEAAPPRQPSIQPSFDSDSPDGAPSAMSHMTDHLLARRAIACIHEAAPLRGRRRDILYRKARLTQPAVPSATGMNNPANRRLFHY